MKTRPGTRVVIKTSDDMGSVEGIYRGHTIEAGCDFIILDIGEAEPFKINAGYIVWWRAKMPAKVMSIKRAKKRLRLIQGT